MSEKYEPEKGDRVRVVIEGEVDWIGDNGFSVSSSIKSQTTTYVSPTGGQVVSIQRLAEPLPTAPGSVIRHRVTGFTYTVTRGGGIFSHSLERIIRHASVSEEVAEHYDVIFDAGAAK